VPWSHEVVDQHAVEAARSEHLEVAIRPFLVVLAEPVRGKQVRPPHEHLATVDDEGTVLPCRLADRADRQCPEAGLDRRPIEDLTADLHDGGHGVEVREAVVGRVPEHHRRQGPGDDHVVVARCQVDGLDELVGPALEVGGLDGQPDDSLHACVARVADGHVGAGGDPRLALGAEGRGRDRRDPGAGDVHGVADDEVDAGPYAARVAVLTGDRAPRPAPLGVVVAEGALDQRLAVGKGGGRREVAPARRHVDAGPGGVVGRGDRDAEDVFVVGAQIGRHVELEGTEVALVAAEVVAVEPDVGEVVDAREPEGRHLIGTPGRRPERPGEAHRAGVVLDAGEQLPVEGHDHLALGPLVADAMAHRPGPVEAEVGRPSSGTAR